MKKLLGLVFNRWVLLAVVLLALSLALWIVGPLVAVADARPLESEPARWMAIAAATVIVVAWNRGRASRNNAQVVNQLLAGAPAGERKDAESPDLQSVRQRFEQALLSMRRTRFGTGGLLAGWRARLGGRYLYE